MNPKQRRFAEEYVIDSNATAAARRAGYSERTAKQQGSRLLTNVDVQVAIQGLHAELRERVVVSVESVTAQLNDAYDQAASNGQASAMVQASMGLAKLHGFLVDKVEQHQVAAADM
ncbi:MAG: terminase small subunit, partial [Kiloniellales bacterium]